MVEVLNLANEGGVLTKLAGVISTSSGHVQLATKSSNTGGDPIRPEWTLAMAISPFAKGDFEILEKR